MERDCLTSGTMTPLDHNTRNVTTANASSALDEDPQHRTFANLTTVNPQSDHNDNSSIAHGHAEYSSSFTPRHIPTTDPSTYSFFNAALIHDAGSSLDDHLNIVKNTGFFNYNSFEK